MEKSIKCLENYQDTIVVEGLKKKRMYTCNVFTVVSCDALRVAGSLHVLTKFS